LAIQYGQIFAEYIYSLTANIVPDFGSKPYRANKLKLSVSQECANQSQNKLGI